METKANYVAVGAFVLACVIGLVVTIMWLAGVRLCPGIFLLHGDLQGPVTGLGKGFVTRFNGIDGSRISRFAILPTIRMR